MKKYVICILSLFVIQFVSGQNIRQKGLVLKYNGKNPKTALGNVRIVAMNAQPVVSLNNGSFTFSFSSMKMGDKISNVKPYSHGLIVFNKDVVENNWYIRKDALVLIMCDRNEFEKQKQYYIEIGRKAAQKKYEAKIKELELQLSSHKIKEADYYSSLQAADEELDNVREKLHSYADIFARLDESEMNDGVKEAVDLLNAGEIEQAIKHIESLELDKKLSISVSQLNAGRKIVKQAEKDIEALLPNIKTQVSMYKLNGDFDKADSMLKLIADSLKSEEGIFEYSTFCIEQHNYKQAETYLEKLICKLSFEGVDNPQMWCKVWDNLGIVNQRLKNFDNAEKYFQQALSKRIELAKNNSNENLSNLSKSYNNLGLYYYELNNYSKAEPLLSKALEIITTLSENDSIYIFDKAKKLHNLGNVYLNMNNYDKAECYFKNALEIRESLFQSPKEMDIADLSSILQSLGTLKMMQNNYIEAEPLLQKSIDLMKKINEINPQAYSEDLAKCYNQLGNLYQNAKKYDDCILAYNEAINILLELSDKQPLIYLRQLSVVQNNLASLYLALEKYDLSIKLFSAVISQYEKCNQIKKGYGMSDFAMSVMNLAITYTNAHQFEKSDSVLITALQMYESLIQINPQAFTPFYAITLNSKAFNDVFLKKFSSAEEYARKAISSFPVQHVFYTNLASSLLFQGKYNEAEKIYREYKDELKDGFLDDFKQFEEVGIIPEDRKADVEKIKKILTE